MRLPTAEFVTFFAATGQLSQLSSPSLRKILIVFSMTCTRLIHVGCHFHIEGAKFSLLDEPACDRSYNVKSGDICNSIAAKNDAPTLVSPYILFAHFTYAICIKIQLPDHVPK